MTDKQAILTLYVGEHCPLCDKAKAVIYPLLDSNWQLVEVSISGDDELQTRYGTRIPVAVMPNRQEKGWPFTASQIRRLMETE